MVLYWGLKTLVIISPPKGNKFKLVRIAAIVIVPQRIPGAKRHAKIINQRIKLRIKSVKAAKYNEHLY